MRWVLCFRGSCRFTFMPVKRKQASQNKTAVSKTVSTEHKFCLGYLASIETINKLIRLRLQLSLSSQESHSDVFSCIAVTSSHKRHQQCCAWHHGQLYITFPRGLDSLIHSNVLSCKSQGKMFVASQGGRPNPLVLFPSLSSLHSFHRDSILLPSLIESVAFSSIRYSHC